MSLDKAIQHGNEHCKDYGERGNRRRTDPTHWFLDRWCAEIVVEDGRHPKEAARHLDVPYAYVIAAVKRVHGCGVSAARHHLHQRSWS